MIAACAAPALAIAFWRCLLGAGVTAPFVVARRMPELRGLTKRQWWLAVAAGLLLGAHFATWIPSLRFTSVASATALVATQPVWAVLIARFRGARVSPQVWIGIAIALLGVLVVTGVDFTLDPRALVGDALALAGAVVMAANVTVGENVRPSMSTATYTTISYSVSGVLMLGLCLLLGQPLSGYSAKDWLLILGLTAIAQLLGHTMINSVLATTPATVTSLAILLEAPGATLIAALWLGQVPPVALIPAFALLFAGLALVILAGDRRTAVESPPV